MDTQLEAWFCIGAKQCQQAIWAAHCGLRWFIRGPIPRPGIQPSLIRSANCLDNGRMAKLAAWTILSVQIALGTLPSLPACCLATASDAYTFLAPSPSCCEACRATSNSASPVRCPACGERQPIVAPGSRTKAPQPDALAWLAPQSTRCAAIGRTISTTSCPRSDDRPDIPIRILFCTWIEWKAATRRTFDLISITFKGISNEPTILVRSDVGQLGQRKCWLLRLLSRLRLRLWLSAVRMLRLLVHGAECDASQPGEPSVGWLVFLFQLARV